MKMKLFLFSTFFLGSMGLSFLWSDTANATGESYRWVSETTIEGSGGAYLTNIRDNDGTSASPVTFTRDGTTGVYKAADLSVRIGSNGPSGITTSCDLQLAIVVGSDVGVGAVRPNDNGAEQCDTNLDTNVTLANEGAAPDPSGFSGTQDEANEEAFSMCGVDGIGWMICPLFTNIAEGVDNVFNLVQEFLIFKSYTTDRETGLYPAWSIMRNFANISFVIAFMIIIFSQLTSMGLNNYGIKKMLPRLILAAILVNVSYWICGLAVDVSNILGASLNNLLMDMAGNVSGEGVDVGWADATLTILSGTAIGTVAGISTIAAAGGFMALLWMLVPILLSAIFAVLVAVVILAARQVLLIIFIVISPLAFVAYLLPNTSKWYDKWQSAFFTLLFMYPIIAVIFGGAQLAAAIILSAENLTMIMVLLALAVQVIPLAITPMVMKLSSGVLGRFAGVVNNPKRGPIDALKTRAKERQELATKRGLDPNNKGWMNRTGQRRAFKRRREQLQGEVHESAADASWAGKTVTDSELQKLVQQKQTNTIASSVGNGVNSKLTTRSLATNGAGDIEGALGDAAKDDDIQAQIKVAIDEATAKSIAEVEVSTNAKIDPGDMKSMGEALASAIDKGDSIAARAVQNILLTSGSAGLDTYRKVLSQDSVSSNLQAPEKDEVSKELRRNVLKKHGGVKSAANDIIQQAVTGDSMKVVSNQASTWQMADEDLVHQKSASLQLALPHIDKDQALRIMTNEELAKNLDKNMREEFNKIAGLNPTVTVQTSAPTTLNIPHSQPPTGGATPANSRTSMPPNTGSMNQQRPSGLWVEPKDRQ